MVATVRATDDCGMTVAAGLGVRSLQVQACEIVGGDEWAVRRESPYGPRARPGVCSGAIRSRRRVVTPARGLRLRPGHMRGCRSPAALQRRGQSIAAQGGGDRGPAPRKLSVLPHDHEPGCKLASSSSSHLRPLRSQRRMVTTMQLVTLITAATRHRRRYRRRLRLLRWIAMAGARRLMVRGPFCDVHGRLLTDGSSA